MPRKISWTGCAALLLAVLLMPACAPLAASGAGGAAKPSPTQTSAAAPADFKRTWMLVALPGFTREQLVAAKAQTGWNELPRAGANMGCNQIGYQVSLGAARADGWREVGIADVFSTRMACPDMRLESAFTRLIATMQQARVEGHRLTLRNAAGQTMAFVAADWD